MVDGTSAQTIRIGSSLAALGHDVELVEDALRRPLVVVVRRAFDAAATAPVIAAATNPSPAHTAAEKDALGVLPYGTKSQQVYSADTCRLLDAVVRAVAGDDVCANRIYGSESGQSIGVGDAPPHTDYPGNVDDPPSHEIHGLNVHFTLAGSAAAQFAAMPNLDAVELVAYSIQQAKKAGLSAVDVNAMLADTYADVMANATPSVAHEAGDVLIFQSRPHPRKELLPTVHKFTTTRGDRWHTIFVPKAASAVEVLNRRRSLIEAHGLEERGYRRMSELTTIPASV